MRPYDGPRNNVAQEECQKLNLKIRINIQHDICSFHHKVEEEEDFLDFAAIASGMETFPHLLKVFGQKARIWIREHGYVTEKVSCC